MRFYDTPLGKLPSVTTILGIADKSQYLVPWAVKLERNVLSDLWWESYQGLTQFEDRAHFNSYISIASNEHKRKLTEATDLGSLVHNMIQCWCEGHFDGDNYEYLLFLSDYYSTQAVKMLGAWFNAIAQNNITVLKSEMTVYHPDGDAGTLDAVCRVDDALIIGDWKTGSKSWIHWLQIEAYRRAYTWMEKEEPVGRMIIYLSKENPGEYEILIRPLEINTEIRIWKDKRKKNGDYQRDINHFLCDHETDYKAFLSAKTLYERSLIK